MIGRDTAPEPSMEEILASIRKIIADDPVALTSSLPLPVSLVAVSSPAAPSVFDSATATPRVEAPQPRVNAPQSSLSARLNDVFGTGTASTEGRPLPSLRAMAARSAVDDDLGDLLADAPQTVVGDQSMTVQPAGRPALTVLAASPASMAPVAIAAPPMARAASPPLSQRVPDPRSEPVVLAAMPVAVRPVAPVDATNFGSGAPVTFRETGFPVLEPVKFANGVAPLEHAATDAFMLSLPTLNDVELSPPASRLLPASRPMIFNAQPLAAAHLSDDAPPAASAPGSYHSFTEARPPAAESLAPVVVAAAPRVVGPEMALIAVTADRQTEESVKAEPVALDSGEEAAFKQVLVSPQPVPAASGNPLANAVEAMPIATPIATPIAIPIANETPASNADVKLPSSPPADVARPDPSADAVASALGALAAGLAASARSPGPEIVVATVDVPLAKPAIAPSAPGEVTGHKVSVLDSGERFAGGVALTPMASSQALEDQAAELLRPMLRQWLDTNMPRIVEKALRIEFAQPTDTSTSPFKAKD